MITSTTLIAITENGTDRQTYINPLQIICIRSVKNSGDLLWRVLFCNDLNIVVDEKNLKTITDHCEVLIKKL